jgi:hypothetical protein
MKLNVVNFRLNGKKKMRSPQNSRGIGIRTAGVLMNRMTAFDGTNLPMMRGQLTEKSSFQAQYTSRAGSVTKSAPPSNLKN